MLRVGGGLGIGAAGVKATDDGVDRDEMVSDHRRGVRIGIALTLWIDGLGEKNESSRLTSASPDRYVVL